VFNKHNFPEAEASAVNSPRRINSPEVVERLIVENLGLISFFARTLSYGRGLTNDERFIAALESSRKAARLYDGRTNFSTYLRFWVRAYIQRAENAAGVIRLPDLICCQVARYRRQCIHLANASGSASQFDECVSATAEDCDLSDKQQGYLVKGLLAKEVNRDHSAATLRHVTEDSDLFPPPLQDMVQEEDLERLRIALESLKETDSRAHEIISLRYGLGEEYGVEKGEEQTLQEIGDRLSLTRERVRQIEEKTLEKLGVLLGISPEEDQESISKASPADVLQAYDLYEHNAVDAADALGLTPFQVRYRWGNAGLVLDGGHQRCLPDDVQRIIAAYETSDGNASRASAQLPFSAETIIRYWRKAGLIIHQKGFFAVIPEEDVQKLLASYEKSDGNPYKAATIVGHCYQTVIKYWKQAQLPVNCVRGECARS